MDSDKLKSLVARWVCALSASTNCGLSVGRKIPAGKGVPPFSWLYKFADQFRSRWLYPKVCSWCATEFTILNERWRVCMRCDTTLYNQEPNVTGPEKGDDE